LAPLLLAWTGDARAENLVANPSAEHVTTDGLPEGWGLYLGAGAMKLSSASDEKHAGERAACLELTDWHTPKDAADAAAQRSVSGAIILAPNNGYSAQGAIACTPGTNYAFSFWYKGDVGNARQDQGRWLEYPADLDRIALPRRSRSC
jgi:hypothetical protein